MTAEERSTYISVDEKLPETEGRYKVLFSGGWAVVSWKNPKRIKNPYSTVKANNGFVTPHKVLAWKLYSKTIKEG